jgi:hypothetical protein
MGGSPLHRGLHDIIEQAKYAPNGPHCTPASIPAGNGPHPPMNYRFILPC